MIKSAIIGLLAAYAVFSTFHAPAPAAPEGLTKDFVCSCPGPDSCYDDDEDIADRIGG